MITVFLGGVIVGVIGKIWFEHWLEQQRQPYRYACQMESCGFKARGSDPVTVIRLSERHTEWHENGEDEEGLI